MDSEKKELNSSEMDQVNGGSIKRTKARAKEAAKTFVEANKDRDFAKDFTTAVSNIGKGVVHWISGLFSGDD